MATQGLQQTSPSARRVLRQRRKRRIATLGAAVVIVTALALMVPAFSMTKGDLICGMEEHVHAEACYDDVLTCGIPENQGHTHNADCYERELTCELEEHQHSADCYAPEPDDQAESATDSGNAGADSDDAQENSADDDQASDQSSKTEGKGSDDADDQVDGVSGNDSSDKGNSASDAEQGDAGTQAEGDAKPAQEDPDDDANEKADADDEHPAQVFTADLFDKDGAAVLTVTVDAPTGAFPANTHMKIDGVEASAVREAVFQALGLDAQTQDPAESVDDQAADAEDAATAAGSDAEQNAEADAAADEGEQADDAESDADAAAQAPTTQSDECLDAVSIRLFDEDGKLIEPAAKVRVMITADAIHSAENPKLVHVFDRDLPSGAKKPADLLAEPVKKANLGFREDFEILGNDGASGVDVTGNARKASAKQAQDARADAANRKGQEDAFAFETAEFGTYAIAQIADAADPTTNADQNATDDPHAQGAANGDMPAATFEKEVSDGQGGTVKVRVKAPKGALPAGTTMRVKRVTNDQIADIAKDAAEEEAALPSNRAQALALDIAFFDADGNEVEPATDVQVTMTAAAVAESAQLAVVHVDDDTNAQVVPLREAGKRGDAVAFDAAEFSVYALVYTVDFTFGGYTVSMPGESTILLSQLADVLDLASATDDAPFNLADVANVEFSDPDLVTVSPVAVDATVNDLLTALDEEGVHTWVADGVVVHQDGMTDDDIVKAAEKIDQVDADDEVNAGDWLITSLKAFQSDETLVITMKNGDTYVVAVTDIDTKTDGKKPGTIDTVDTASKGITITMFDYGPEKLDNVTNTYNSADNSGINSGHQLKFYAYGTEGSTMNNFTGGAYAMQGIVQSKLDANGYPVISSGSRESLEYLFGTGKVNGKTVYEGANYLFKDEGNGMLSYDSDKNYAYMDPNTHKFTVYNDTYLEEGADSSDPLRIGFFPYNDYDNRYHCIHGNNFNWGCSGSKDWRVRDQVGHYNHHFGMKVEGKFYMTPDKKLENGKDMVFNFSGDDDMWVFIDGVLVLDIGGIHNPVSGNINFTTGQVTVSAVKTASGGSDYALGANTTIAQAFEKAGKTWDDSPLSSHDIKIFYMERGGMYSNLAISMNLPTYKPLEVTFDKTKTDETTMLAGAKFELYSDPACTKPVTEVGPDGKTVTVRTVSSATQPLGQVKVENIVPGQVYYLKEVAAPEGYKVSDTVYMIDAGTQNGGVYVPTVWKLDSNGNKVEPNITKVPNAPDVYGSFDFEKVEEDAESTKLEGAEFTLYTDADCQTIATDKAGQNLVTTSGSNGQVSFANIPAGKTYYMKETKEPTGYIPSSDVYTVTLDANGNATVSKGGTTVFTQSDSTKQITNKPKAEKTSMSVEKVWSDGAANHTNDTVEVTLYETHVDTGKTGGNISFTVEAGNWYKDGSSPAESTTAPQSGSITYKLQKKVGDGGSWVDVDPTTYALSYSATEANSWKHQHTGLPDMDKDQSITYRAVVTNQSTPAVVADANINSTEVSANGGTATITAGVQESASAGFITVSATGMASKDQWNSWQINFSEVKLKYNQSGASDYSGWVDQQTSYVWNDFMLGPSKSSVANEMVTITGDKSKYVYGFHLQVQNVPDNDTIKVYVSPGGKNQNGTDLGNPITFKGNESNLWIWIPATAAGISISFEGPHTDAGTSSLPSNRFSMDAMSRVARNVQLAIDNLVTTGETTPENANIVPVCDSDITPDGITNPVTLKDGAWGHTWSGLLASKEITEGGYTFTRTYTYYVKETKVTLADGDSESTVLSSYKSEDGKTIITNTVPPKTSLEVTKRWTDANGTPVTNQTSVTFEVRQVVKKANGEIVDGYPKTFGSSQTITYDPATGKWSTVTIDNLPTKVKVDNALLDATYYVVETFPEASDDLTTYYESSDGKTYADPADAAGSTSETIVNVESPKEIKITKAWYYQNGNSRTLVAEPPVKDVYFKIAQVDGYGADRGYYEGATEVVEEQPSQSGPRYHIECKSITKQQDNGAGGTRNVTTWAWDTLTFKNLPREYKYYLVETDASGKPLTNDTKNKTMEITYTDENGKEVTNASPIDPSIPGNYTINNIEKRTTLYAEKIWNAANKDNLADGKPVWFRLMRIKTDGNGTYDGDAEEVQKFSMSDSAGWTKAFNDLQVAPLGQTVDAGQHQYYQYYIEELGLSSNDKANGDFTPISDLIIRYQSKGSGTGATKDEDRAEYYAYGDGVKGVGQEDGKSGETVSQWLATNEGKVAIRTWLSTYDGTGTLGVFNSSTEYLKKPLKISKTWKNAAGEDLTSEELREINAIPGEGDNVDPYTVEIQLMQRAENLKKSGSNEVPQAGPIDVEYGSPFTISASSVVKQSDLFEVVHEGADTEANWKFTIPVTVEKDAAGGKMTVNQLPASGAFRYNNENYTAEFSYYISEYRVYDKNGKNVTSTWTAACKSTGDNTEFKLELENRKTSDLTVHKKWAGVTAANAQYLDDHVKAVLYKVKRKIDNREDEDVTDLIADDPSAYGLTQANDLFYEKTIKDGETVIDESQATDSTKTYTATYEYYVRVNQPTSGNATSWDITGGVSTGTSKLITGLEAYERNYLSDSDLANWPKYTYWLEEAGYLDENGNMHSIGTLLHGNTAAYPEHHAKSESSATTPWGTAQTEAKNATVQLGATLTNHLGVVNTTKGTDLKVMKVDKTNTNTNLQGATFKLTRKDANGSYATFDYDAYVDGTTTFTLVKGATPDNGQFTIATAANGFQIKSLMPGVYKLEELKAPDGYILTGTESIEFEVTMKGKIVVPGTTTELTSTALFDFTNTTANGQQSGELKVKNTPGKALPVTGSHGTAPTTALGIALALGATVVLIKRRRAADSSRNA